MMNLGRWARRHMWETALVVVDRYLPASTWRLVGSMMARRIPNRQMDRLQWQIGMADCKCALTAFFCRPFPHALTRFVPIKSNVLVLALFARTNLYICMSNSIRLHSRSIGSIVLVVESIGPCEVYIPYLLVLFRWDPPI